MEVIQETITFDSTLKQTEIMKDQDIKKIEKVVRENRLVSKRVEVLTKMGFEVAEFAMGPGGKLQQKRMSDGTIRVQIGYGHGRYNYAMAVIL